MTRNFLEAAAPHILAPQWSPLTRSGMTLSRSFTPGPAEAAAMEPAHQERDDHARNAPTSTAGAAAMEPAHQERDDR